MTRPSAVPRAFAVAAALLAVACAAVVTGSAVGTFSASDRATGQVSRPTGDPASPPAAPSSPAGEGAAPDPGAVLGAQVTSIPMGTAGTVVLAVENGRLRVRQVQPATGWQVDRVEDSGDRVEVRLRGAGEARLEASVVGGRVVVDRLRAPGV